jgi:hypothetical protein
MKEYPDIEGWVTYVPEFDENREDDEPITSEIRPLTVRESMRRSGNVTARQTKGGGVATNSADIQRETFVAHVRNIRNLGVGGKAITTPEALLDTQLHGLVTEIQQALTDASRLAEGDVKNFKSRSAEGSSTAGTAPTATSGGE